MRLVVTYCDQCHHITDAKHAETLGDLEQISEFIRAKKQSSQKLSLLDYRDDQMLRWCGCAEQHAPAVRGWNQALSG